MKLIKKQIGDYLNYCKNVRRMTDATMLAKENVLKRFEEVTQLNDLKGLTNEVFDGWVEYEIGRGISARSVNVYNSVVLAMVRYYQGVGILVPLKTALIGKLKEGKIRRGFYTAGEVARVVERADEEVGLMIEIMFETGMRIAELAGLRVSDFDGRRVRFVGKGRKPREVYVGEGVLGRIRKYIIRYEIADYLWVVNGGMVTKNGEPLTVNTIRNKMKGAFGEVGIDDFYPHALRHSFATDLQLRGASIEEIKEMIGHESIATTERYLHGFDGRLKELFEKYR